MKEGSGDQRELVHREQVLEARASRWQEGRELIPLEHEIILGVMKLFHTFFFYMYVKSPGYILYFFFFNY